MKLLNYFLALLLIVVLSNCAKPYESLTNSNALKSAILSEEAPGKLSAQEKGVIDEFYASGNWKRLAKGKDPIINAEEDFKQIEYNSIPVYSISDEAFEARKGDTPLLDLLVRDYSNMFFIGKYKGEIVTQLYTNLVNGKWNFTYNAEKMPIVEWGKRLNDLKAKVDGGNIFILNNSGLKYFAYFKQGGLHALMGHLSKHESDEGELLTQIIRQRDMAKDYKSGLLPSR